MQEQKFELDLRMSENGIICNAEMLKGMLPEKLKPYNYVVTVNNYSDAKSDRAKLNNLHKIIQDKRKQFEEVELNEWKKQKAILMDIEKLIKSAADALGDGIKKIDEEEQVAKMEEVREQYNLVSEAMPIKIPFEKFYIRKDYDKKTMTVDKILEDMQKKVNKAVSDWKMLGAYLPTDEADIEQVKRVFADTLDVGLAKSKADELKAIREQIIKRQQAEKEMQNKQSAQPQIPPQGSQALPKQQMESGTDEVKVQRIKFEIIAERPFFDMLNQMVSVNKNHIKSLKVLEREDM